VCVCSGRGGGAPLERKKIAIYTILPKVEHYRIFILFFCAIVL